MLAGRGPDGNGPLPVAAAGAKMTYDTFAEDGAMRAFQSAAIIGATLAAVGITLAADTGDVTALIDRALEAAGGADRLAQPRAYTFKQEMTTRNKKVPAGLTTHSTFFFQPPKKFRMEEEGELNGKAIKYIEVINGNRGWGKRNGATLQLSQQAIAHPLETQQAFGYKFILLLRDKTNKASALGESTAGDQTLVGLKLTHAVGRGSEERRLFFDAKTMLLARSELHAKQSTGTEMGTEQTWSDYKTIDGIAVPHKVTHTIKDAAGTTIERVYSEFKFVEQHDPHLFDAP
jgi:outer membrane lipoprotein-sorting protein